MWLGDHDRLGQRCAQLATRVDAELGVDLAQVPFDRADAEEELGGDLLVRVAAGRWPRVSSLRLRTVSPVASSSRRLRSANASAPI